jgi:cell fate regulator YaaT (PSP1 superfamily)
MEQWLDVRLRRETHALCVYHAEDPLGLGRPVIVRLEGGEHYGVVARKGTLARLKSKAREGGGPPPAAGKVVRPASPEDTARNEMLAGREREALRVTMDKIAAHGLEMDVCDAEWLFDGSKLLFYFTADKRVDFRGLVKDLAATFRARIELRQIGAREETRRFGGYGVCGQRLCCSAWLPDFEPVTLKMAKQQNPSLSPMKMTGS